VPIAALVFVAVRELFPARRVAAATGIIGASAGGIVALVPLLAGWLIDNYGFRGTLWFLSACTAIALVLVIAFLPETPKRRGGGSFDWLGVLLLGGSVTALIYGTGQGAEWGWTSPKSLGLLLGAAASAVAFVLVERAAAHPLMDIEMFTRRDVAAVLISTSLVQGMANTAAGTMVAILTLYPNIPGVSGGLGWSVTRGAVVGLPAGILLFAVGIAIGAASRRLNPRRPWLLGVGLLTLGLVLQGFYHHNEWQIITFGIIVALGIAMVFATTPVLILRSVSREEMGVASGMSLMLIGLMTTVGIQVAFTVLNRHSTVLEGIALYNDTGYSNAFFTLAGCVAIGLLISLFIPRLRTTDEEA
jgi:MFS family permease